MASKRKRRVQRFRAVLDESVQAMFSAAADLDLSPEEWATKAWVHVRTLMNLANGRTRFPYWQTVEALAEAVDLTSRIQRQKKQRRAA